MNKLVHKNNWFSVKKDLIKNQNVYYFVKKKPAVFIIAETIEKKIIFIREYRYPINKTIWQLPAGGIDTNNSLLAAKKELFEETGLKSKKWKKLGHYFVAPGHENTKIFVFQAKCLKEKDIVYKKEKNIVDIKAFSKSEVISMIKKNSILCSISLAALNLYLIKQSSSLSN